MAGDIAGGVDGETTAFEVEGSSCSFVAFRASLWCRFTLLEKEVVSPVGLKIPQTSVNV